LRLIAKMDQDNDGWIIADDLVKFSAKHYLFFEEKVRINKIVSWLKRWLKRQWAQEL